MRQIQTIPEIINQGPPYEGLQEHCGIRTLENGAANYFVALEWLLGDELHRKFGFREYERMERHLTLSHFRPKESVDSKSPLIQDNYYIPYDLQLLFFSEFDIPLTAVSKFILPDAIDYDPNVVSQVQRSIAAQRNLALIHILGLYPFDVIIPFERSSGKILLSDEEEFDFVVTNLDRAFHKDYCEDVNRGFPHFYDLISRNLDTFPSSQKDSDGNIVLPINMQNLDVYRRTFETLVDQAKEIRKTEARPIYEAIK